MDALDIETRMSDLAIAPGASAVAELVRHPMLDRLLARIPRAVVQSFSADQMRALSEATRVKPADHWIDYRASTFWLGKRVYIRLLVGEERRNLRRLQEENQISVARTAVLFATFGWLLTTVVGAVLFIVCYLIKSQLGIDLIDGPSFLHQYFFD